MMEDTEMDGEELLKVIKKYIVSNNVPFISFNELKKASKLSGDELSELIGTLKEKNRLKMRKVQNSRLYFPQKMIETYAKSKKL